MNITEKKKVIGEEEGVVAEVTSILRGQFSFKLDGVGPVDNRPSTD